jgi:hypothetical protein
MADSVVKVRFNGTTRKIICTADVKWNTFKNILTTRFNLAEQAFELNYADEDDDLITIVSCLLQQRGMMST